MSGVLYVSQSGDLVYRGPYDPLLVEAIQEISGRKWVAKRREWLLPLNSESVNAIKAFPSVRIVEDVWSALQLKQEALDLAQVIKHDEKVKPIEDMPVKAKPFAHQIKAFNIALSLPNTALLHEQGCGKTMTAIAVIGSRYRRNEIKRVLVVSPLSVVPVWEHEFEDKADFPFVFMSLTGKLTQRAEQLRQAEGEGVHVAAVNYESVWRPGMFEALIDWAPDMVICDESQRIKSSRAKQSKGMYVIGDKTKHKMILTGTPVTATPMDFWSQYRFLDNSVFGKSFFSFRTRYAVMGGWQNKQVVGFKHKTELINKAHSIAHRVTKDEALDLPDQIDQNLYCQLEASAEKTYRELLRQNVSEIEDLVRKGASSKVITSNVLTRLLRLQQLTGGFVTTEDNKVMQVSKAKLNLLKEAISDILQAGKKVVVFARFIPEIKAILRMLESEDFGVEPFTHAKIFGEIPTQSAKEPTRGDMVQKFQSDPECRAFVAQIQTAGLGITLHAASTAVFYSADFNYANYDQCRARLHRIGQKNTVNHIHLIARGTVDEKVYQALASKRSIAKDVVDNWRNYINQA